MDALAKETLEQIAALPFRIASNGHPEVLLVTSRETGRWIIPKGWPMKNLDAPAAAAQEALEEAGVLGDISPTPIGHYIYWKRRPTHFVLCRVAVYALKVREELEAWPEKDQRKLHWFTPEEASMMVLEPDLGVLVRGLGGYLSE